MVLFFFEAYLDLVESLEERPNYVLLPMLGLSFDFTDFLWEMEWSERVKLSRGVLV